MVVLIAGSRKDEPTDSAQRQAWLSVQDEKLKQKKSLADMSHNSKVIIDPTSEHHIQLDDPALVVQSIKEMLEAVKTNSPLK